LILLTKAEFDPKLHLRRPRQMMIPAAALACPFLDCLQIAENTQAPVEPAAVVVAKRRRTNRGVAGRF
jgi:hypothetical protein